MENRISIMNRARLQKRRHKDVLVSEEAKRLFETYKNEPLFISGIVLYWAEGTRINKIHRKYQLALTNSDAGLVRFYCGFLQKFFPHISKADWRIGLFLYPDIDVKQAITYWSRISHVPPDQFIKPQIINGQIAPRRRLPFGTCCVYANSKDACITMQSWIDLLRR